MVFPPFRKIHTETLWMGGKLNDDVQYCCYACVLMTCNDALPVLSTKNDGHCHHSHIDPQSKGLAGWPARLSDAGLAG